MDIENIAKILGIAFIAAVVKIIVLLFIPPLWHISWGFSCSLFNSLGVQNKTTLGILFFIFTWISPSSLFIGVKLSD